MLEKAKAGLTGPENVLALARIYAQAGEYPAVVAVLEPYLAEKAKPVYEIWILAADVRLKSGDFAGAVDVLDGAMAHFGTNSRF